MYKAFDKWLFPYLRSVWRRPREVPGPVHVMFAVCDHYEPLWPLGKSAAELGHERVRRWLDEYPRSVADFVDADGCRPKHTLFFPEEEYQHGFLAGLEGLVGQGLGEVEIHLHHRHDTPQGLEEKLTRFRDLLHRQHGFLGCDADGALRYGFIHGNWTLCNSRPDGDWCGVNEELGILHETGCYADFTFPSVPSPTQPRMVNSLYYARDLPGRPRGHDQGREVWVEGQNHGWARMGTDEARAAHETHERHERDRNRGQRSEVSGQRAEVRGQRADDGGQRAGVRRQRTDGGSLNTEHRILNTAPGRAPAEGDGELLLVQGPLALNWGWRKWGVLPRIEHADVGGSNPPSPARADLWVRQHIHVRGRPDWIFVKVHTHGCQERTMDVLLGEPMRALHRHLTTTYNDGRRYRLHYVSAREMVNIVRAAEAGQTGEPGEYRDFEVGKPPAAG